MGTTDEQLIGAIAARDEFSFEVFYRRHVDRVMAYAYRRCRDPHEVAELCASVFVSVWEGAGTFDSERGSATAWLHGIAARRFIDLRRRDQRTASLRQRLEHRAVVSADDVERINERLDVAAASSDLVAALRDLPDPQREVMALVALDGLSAVEAAELLNTSPTAVRMRLSRARRTLRQRFGTQFTRLNSIDTPLEVVP